MADTLKFGPEWLRQLSGGNSVSTPPPSPAPGFGKYKLADYRYGREEMLALFTPSEKMPEDIIQFTPIVTEKAQKPLAFVAIGEEEQRIMSQSVNSMAVMRMMGRGAPPVRGGRGGTADRGRGRGRGRGDGFMQRGISYDEGEVGFGRARPRQDGWEEAGPKRFDRNYPIRYDDTGIPQPGGKVYQRSLSSDNWRDREEDDDENDWRKAGPKWNVRGNWRESSGRGGHEYDRGYPGGPTRGGYSRQYQRSRSSESWDEEEMPEWNIPDTGDMEELGTFDSSGAFVSTKPPFQPKGKRRDMNGDRLEETEENDHEEPVQTTKQTEKPSESQEKEDSDINQNKTKTKATSERAKKEDSPKTNSAQERKENTESKTVAESKRSNNNKPVSKTETVTQKKSQSEKSSTEEVKNNSERTETSSPVTESKVQKETPVTPEVPPPVEKPKKKVKSEAEALDQMRATVENMVLEMTVEDEEKEETDSAALPPDHENYNKWFYRDPQGDLQGPFTSGEMAEWFSAGYFTMNLNVRRGCDQTFSPLGELIKHWGRVPFVPGPSPPPMLKNSQPSPDVTQQQQQREQEQMQAIQQQILLQQQLVQQQMLMRHMQMHQINQIVQQLQENEAFKSLPPLQQQQIAMQMMLKQPQQLLMSHQSQSQPKLSRTPPAEAPVTVSPPTSHPSFHRSLSTPNTSQGHHEDTSHPTVSIWDLEPMGASPSSLTASDLTAQLQRLEKEKLEQQQAEEKKYQEELERQQAELRKQQEEIQRQKDDMERQRLELERQRQLETQRLEEEKKKAEEERRRLEEEKRQKMEEEKRRKEEEERRRQEEERRRIELERQQELQRQQEIQRQQELQKQQLEAQKKREMEELERQKQAEIERRQAQEAQRQQDIQRQQEALRTLQQEQLANMQLPSHAQWGNSSSVVQSAQQSLLEIQQMQEEKDRKEREEMQRKQTEAQRQHMLAMQHQQQQQKTWSNTIATAQANTTKSLLEIQEEQARQLERERQKREENQQQAAKNLSLSSATVWNSAPPQVSHWASEGAWGSALRANTQQNKSNSALGFWDEAIISSSVAPAPVPTATKKSNKKGNADFPALGGGSNKAKPAPPQTKQQKQSKTKKEEEAVQRLFQSVKPTDDFTTWCETTLRSMDASVHIPTFIAFLQEVESPYEIHDYVRSYLGESRAANEFGKQFLEKRSQYRNKSKPVVQEDSIWGPAPAITPRELRHNPPAPENDGQKSKSSKKKKNKMMKVDSSILGFTVHAAPDRIVGEIENVEVTGSGAR